VNPRVGAALLLLLLLGGLPGCEQDPRAPLDLDDIVDLEGDCVVVIHERLELGPDKSFPIHRYVADQPSSPGGWALVTHVDLDSDTPKQLAMLRVPASSHELATPPILLGQPSIGSTHIELRPGVAPGELWVLQDAGNNAAVRRLVPELGAIAENGSLANFPSVPAGVDGCPSRFNRQLLLIDGRPHVLALPDCSDAPTLDLHLLELDGSALFLNSWMLSFDPAPGDFSCVITHSCTIDPIGPGESTLMADAERVAVGFTQVRDFGNDETSSDVSILDIRLTAAGPKPTLVTFRQVWLTPTNLGPVRLAHDPFSVHFHVRNGSYVGGVGHDAALFRFDNLGETYVQLTTSLPFDGAGRLVQLDSQAVILHVTHETLRAIPLIDVASWPDWKPRTLMKLEGLSDLEPAGVGQVLLRRKAAPPQVVQLRCSSGP
jgi:hypothetical protein